MSNMSRLCILISMAIGLGVTAPLPVLADQASALRSGGQGRIYNGDDVNPGEGDWVVPVLRNKKAHCGGSLVHPLIKDGLVSSWEGHIPNARWVLTAAHCLYEPSGRALTPEELTVKTGSVLFSDMQETRQVLAIIEHEGYDSDTLENDIALLYLDPADADDVINNRASIALPSNDDIYWITKPYLQTYAMGWGRTETDFGSETLQQVRVPIVDHQTCATSYAQAGGDIAPGMICAGFARGEYDSCQGDSGGPLAHRPRGGEPTVLVGVVSWGIGCGLPDLPGVYSSTLYFLPWITNAVEKCEKENNRRNCTTRVVRKVNRSFVRMISGDIALFPKGCETDGNKICNLAEPIRYEQRPGLVWESGIWQGDGQETGTTDGASIPKWAQPVIGEPFDRSYLKAAILHDHYCYKENHVRSWQQVHRMFFDALIDSGVKPVKARTMYYAVWLGGPRWKALMPGESCGVGCIKSRLANSPERESTDWVPSHYSSDEFARLVLEFHTRQTEDKPLDLAEIARQADLARPVLQE